MYLWKAWQDSRTRVIVYIVAALCVGVLSSLQVVSYENYRTASSFRFPAKANWDFYMVITFFALFWVIPYAKAGAVLAALSLGASGVGRDYGAGTMHFVLTRPAARRNLVFTDWMIGLTASVLVVGGIIFGVVPFLYFARAQGPGNILIVLPGMWAWTAAIYGLASFTTLVAGSASMGLVLSTAVVLTYDFLPESLHSWWHVDAMLRARDWTLQFLDNGLFVFFNGEPLQFHWGVILFWLAMAAVFLGASAAWIGYREV